MHKQLPVPSKQQLFLPCCGQEVRKKLYYAIAGLGVYCLLRIRIQKTSTQQVTCATQSPACSNSKVLTAICCEWRAYMQTHEACHPFLTTLLERTADIAISGPARLCTMLLMIISTAAGRAATFYQKGHCTIPVMTRITWQHTSQGITSEVCAQPR